MGAGRGSRRDTAGADAGVPVATLRIDKLLWYLRFARSRSRAQAIAMAGHVRLNGRRVTSAHCPVRVGDILTLPTGRAVRTARILTIPTGRKGASEAAAHWEEPPAR